jgi:hypothetical protein
MLTELALAVDQDKVIDWPALTLAALEEKVAVGTGITVTTVVAVAVPPLPIAVIM